MVFTSRVLSVNKFLKFFFSVAYFPCWFLKMAISFSQPYCLCCVCVKPGFPDFDRMIFGRFSFPSTRWNVVTVRDTQMVRDQKKLGDHCFI